MDIEHPALSVLGGYSYPIRGAGERVFGDIAQIAFRPVLSGDPVSKLIKVHSVVRIILINSLAYLEQIFLENSLPRLEDGLPPAWLHDMPWGRQCW